MGLGPHSHVVMIKVLSVEGLSCPDPPGTIRREAFREASHRRLEDTALRTSCWAPLPLTRRNRSGHEVPRHGSKAGGGVGRRGFPLCVTSHQAPKLGS